MKISMVITIFMILTFAVSCSDSDTTDITEVTDTDTSDEDEDNNSKKIFITDRTGKKWDITHAVERYEMDPENFNFGLGPNAIPPITEAKFLKPGDSDYPESNANFTVIGIAGGNEARAYPTYILARREVVDDKFLGTHLAVVY